MSRSSTLYRVALGAIIAAWPAWCQTSQDEIIQKLLARVEALEREVAELKQGATPSPATPAREASAPSPATRAALVEGAPPAQVPDPDQTDTSRFTFHGYADAGFSRNANGDSTKRFAQGEMDLFATARISPKLTALIETVLETDNQLTVANVPVNVERLLLQYRQNDYFNLDIGSFRTAMGFYSTTYLRGSWLQTALTRPRLFTFEDDGGFLPLHNVGLSANGIVPSGGLGLHYVVEVGSSRNYAQTGRSGFDLEQNGAFNVALFSRPRAIPGLQVGFSSYRDRLSPIPGSVYDRSVWTAHFVYQGHRVEFLNEGLLARFRNATDGHVSIPGFYSQIAYRVGSNWRPYFRMDYANVYGRGNVVAGAIQYLPWRRVETGGIRYDLSDAVALKFEMGHETNLLRTPWINAALQVAFTF